MGALLAMRRNASAGLAHFLHDADARLVREAAIAINDLPIPDAMADLAKLMDDANPLDVPTLLRAINANFRSGTPEGAVRLALRKELEAIDEEDEREQRVRDLTAAAEENDPRG